MKLRLTIIILIVALTIGSIVVVTGFISDSKYVEIPTISNSYEKLQKYKNELEKINQYNQAPKNKIHPLQTHRQTGTTMKRFHYLQMPSPLIWWTGSVLAFIGQNEAWDGQFSFKPNKNAKL